MSPGRLWLAGAARAVEIGETAGTEAGALRSLLAVVLPLAIWACSDTFFAIHVGRFTDAPTIIIIHGRTLTLKTNLIRDALPAPRAGGGRLLVRVTVKATDGRPLSDGVGADSVWVVSGEEIWAARLESESAGSNEIRGVARGGPAWEPGTEVDVVVRVLGDSRPRLLRATDQRIRLSVADRPASEESDLRDPTAGPDHPAGPR
ncbi:MAG: hypothetical protein ACE5JR_09215 [Gemmatimonadota bacterium]